jgi:hypothetical protein
MLRKTIGLLLLGILTAGLAAAAEEPVPVSKKAGYALLDLYINAFRSMATAGAKETLSNDLDRMMTEAKKAKTAGDIDAPFLARYNRLVAVTKLITMQNADKTAVPVFKAELERFIMDVLGVELKGEGAVGIGQMADALAYAIIDLQIYLDTLDGRQARYDKLVKSFAGPQK